MRLHFALACLASLITLSAGAADAPTQQPYTSLPYTPSLDLAAMDRTVDPCDDLYTYSCGGWQKNNPIPADQSKWDVYRKLAVDSQQYLWGILQESAQQSAGRTPERQKIGDYFAACMDEAAIEKRGLAAIEPKLARIRGIQAVRELPQLLAELHRDGVNGAFFASSSEQDAKDATKVIAGVYASGLSLPDRDYYTKTDAKSKEILERYRKYVAQMFTLAGSPTAQAEREAEVVLRVETTLAKASLTRVEQRNPYNIYHRTTVAELRKETPAFDWGAYFSAVGLVPDPWFNNAEPKFVAAMNALIRSESLANVKSYLRWMVLDAEAGYLSKAFVDANFNFHSAYLRGVREQRPRWKRCVSWVDRDLGEALGKEFVARTFPAQTKAATVRMTEQIQVAMKARIEALDWMSPETKVQALAKLAKMRNKVGYPDQWRDYSALEVKRDDFYGNVTRANAFEYRRLAAKIGKPVDRNEWGMTPVTVNAYYNSSMNDINFPAAVLLPPLYDAKMDDAPNYGNTGGTIGHELTHGFDDEGRQYDGDGNLHDWWKEKDAKEFEKRAQCVKDQYAHYRIVDDITINSALTAGEDIADLGGLILAWVAWQEQTKTMRLAPVDGLTPDQRFFVGFAQWACANQRPEQQRIDAVTNPHSPPYTRINGVVVNMPEFAHAFSCKAGKKLVKPPAEVCRIW